MRIAVADDEATTISFLTEIVQEMGHIAVPFSDGNALINGLMRDTFDLLILDWSMPGRDGFDVLQWMQESLEVAPPVMMLTARTAKNDIVRALSRGADDYITKPEDREVIAARIGALLRRAAPSDAFAKTVQYGPYLFDRLEQRVSFGDNEVVLTAKEFDLADLMFRNMHRTLSRAYIMETIWRTSASLSTRTLDMHVSRLRTKLDLRPENGYRIHTVFGYGYRLETVPTS